MPIFELNSKLKIL